VHAEEHKTSRIAKKEEHMTAELTNQAAQFDVAIVGCGPVGALLANFLKQYGHKVAILDRELDVFYAPRGMAFDDESTRIMQSVGILDRLKAEGHIYQADLELIDRNGKRLGGFDRRSVGEDLLSGLHGHRHLTQFHQPSLEAILREEFSVGENAASSFFYHEVTEINDLGEQVELRCKNRATNEDFTISASYVVGCDGARSIVRKTMSVPRVDLKYTERYLVVDAIVDDPVYFRTRIPQGGYILHDGKEAGVLAKGLHGHVRFDFLQHSEIVGAELKNEKDYQDAARALIESRGFEPENFRVIRSVSYTFYAGMPSRWRVGRLLVAGDAAHLTPPWSGQGLNMGIRDAANLSFKLSLVLNKKTSDRILDTYDDERRPQSLETIQAAVDMGIRMQSTSPLQIGLRNFVYALSRSSKFVNRLLFRNWIRKPGFKSGLIGLQHRLSGTPMFQPWVQTPDGERRRMDDLIGLRFALISTDSPTGPEVTDFVRSLGGVVLKLDYDFFDPGETVCKWYDKNRINAVLLRPDRVIYDAGRDGRALCRSLLSELRK